MLVIFSVRLFLSLVDSVIFAIAAQWDGHNSTLLQESNVRHRRLYGRMIPLFLCFDLFFFIFCLYFFPGLRHTIALWFLEPLSGIYVCFSHGFILRGDGKGSRQTGPNTEELFDKDTLFARALDHQKKVINGLIPRAGGRGLIRVLLKVHRLVHASAPSKSDVKICKDFSGSLYQLRRDSGPTFLLQYLKGCSVLLQQSVGNHKIPDPRAVGPAVSRTRAGLPRIIPRQQRLLIRRGDPKVIQFYLSIFNLYRLLDCKYKSDPLVTIRSGSGLPTSLDFIQESREFLPTFYFSWLSRFITITPSNIRDLLIKKGRELQPFLSSKSSVSFPTSNISASSYAGIMESVYSWREHFLLCSRKEESKFGKPSQDDLFLWRGFLTWNRIVTPSLLSLVGFQDKVSLVNQVHVTPVQGLSLPTRVDPYFKDSTKEIIEYSMSGDCHHPPNGICSTCIRSVRPVRDDGSDAEWILNTRFGKQKRSVPVSVALPLKSENLMEDPTLVVDVRGRLLTRFAQAWNIFGNWGLKGLKIVYKDLTLLGAERSGFGGTLKKVHYWYLGRLVGLKEAAGKLRVIAMVDIITQWMLSPLHNIIFSILRRIPSDGTFDQEAPILRLRVRMKGRSDKFSASYDLSAATDCLPLSFQKLVLSMIIGEQLAEAWGDILTRRTYFWKMTTPVKYGVGQPMGALSSWASLAITHHFIVQWASWRSGRRTGWFQEYAVLGDDVVIADRKVASEYLLILGKLGVKVGLAKSIVSDKGVMEFAKKFYSPRYVMTPIPVKELLVSELLFPVFMNLIRKYPYLRISDLVSLMGYKYKTLGSLHSNFSSLPKKVKTVLITYLAPGNPGHISLEHWLRSVSLVNGRSVSLDKGAIMIHILDQLSRLRLKSSTLARQPGLSIDWLRGDRDRIEELDGYFKLVNWESAVLVQMMAEEDRPLYNKIKRMVYDGLSIEQALKSHLICVNVEEFEKEILSRFFLSSLEETLLFLVKLQDFDEALHNVSVIDIQCKPKAEFRPDARKWLKFYNKLHKFNVNGG